MIDDFGAEFKSVLTLMDPRQVEVAKDELSEGGDVGPAFDYAIVTAQRALGSFAFPSGVVLYFPPGRYVLRQSYVLPPNVQLFFSPGALLRPAEHTRLIIQGTIRAGKYQIFGYDRYVAPLTRLHFTAPTGQIYLHSSLIPEVYPEWWGAFAPATISAGSPTGQDSTDAIQAAINAACIFRDAFDGGLRRPSIPVVLTGHYQCNETLVVRCPAGTSDVHLILRGSRGLSPVYGGVPTITRVRPTGDARQDGCLLRLGPGVGFDIQDVSFGMAGGGSAVNGTIDIHSDASELAPRRGLFRRCVVASGTEYGLRVDGATGSLPRHIVVDSCEIVPMNVDYVTDRAVDLAGSVGMMLHIDSALMGMGVLKASTYPLPLRSSAGIYQQGGSLLVRASQFHSGTGPRPSPDRAGSNEIDLTKPDGQDVFLAGTSVVAAAPVAASQFTAMQCESQSWWFLSRPADGDQQVVVLSLAHESPNWSGENLERRNALLGRTVAASAADGYPPSVVWLGLRGQCVLVACRLQDSVLSDVDACANITNVATFFKGGSSRVVVPPRAQYGAPQFFRPSNVRESIIRPPEYLWVPLASPATDALDRRIAGVVVIRRFSNDSGET